MYVDPTNSIVSLTSTSVMGVVLTSTETGKSYNDLILSTFTTVMYSSFSTSTSWKCGKHPFNCYPSNYSHWGIDDSALHSVLCYLLEVETEKNTYVDNNWLL